MRILSILLFLFQLSLVEGFSQADNKKPMYGEVSKTKEQKETDESFIKAVVEQFGSKEKAGEAHIGLAWKYFYNDSLVVAMKRFNQAWMLNPENPDSYFGFAALMEIKGDSNEAKRLYKIGIEKDKSNQRSEKCYQRIADCKEQIKDFRGTIDAYKKIVVINPQNIFAYKKLGYFYSYLSDNSSSLKNYNNAITLAPNDAMTYNNRGYLYQKMKQFDNAISDYSKAVELDENYISAYVNRGISRMEIKDFEGAKNDFLKCTKLDPKAGELFRFLGLAKLELKDKKGACADFEKAMQLGDAQINELILQNCK